MKAITKKVIESGLVPKHTLLLMRRWGYLDPESLEIPEIPATPVATSDLQNAFIKFVEELEELIEAEEEEEVKETIFPSALEGPIIIYWDASDPCFIGKHSRENLTVVFKDEMGRLVITASDMPRIGRRFRTSLVSDDWFEIITRLPLWVGDVIAAYQVDTELVAEPNAKMPKLP